MVTQEEFDQIMEAFKQFMQYVREQGISFDTPSDLFDAFRHSLVHEPDDSTDQLQ